MTAGNESPDPTDAAGRLKTLIRFRVVSGIMGTARRALLGAVAGALTAGIAGCAGSDGGEATTAPTTATATTTPTDAATATTTPTATPTTGGRTGVRVATRDHPEHGPILVDGAGLTLYVLTNDPRRGDRSTCTGACADAWPPLTTDDPGAVTAGGGVSATLGTFKRSGGSTQVTANGWPLYYFASDETPGDAKGQGVNGVWWVVGPDGTPIRSTDGGGY